MDEEVDEADSRSGVRAAPESDITKVTDTALDPGTNIKPLVDEAIDVHWNRNQNATLTRTVTSAAAEGQIRTLDGEIAGDEFAGDAVNYQILLGKIDGLLDRLRLDA